MTAFYNAPQVHSLLTVALYSTCRCLNKTHCVYQLLLITATVGYCLVELLTQYMHRSDSVATNLSKINRSCDMFHYLYKTSEEHVVLCQKHKCPSFFRVFNLFNIPRDRLHWCIRTLLKFESITSYNDYAQYQSRPPINRKRIPTL